jgi:hypothetical protein
MDVHRVSGTLLLPPTETPRGPLGWVHPPEPESLPLCREIDVGTHGPARPTTRLRTNAFLTAGTRNRR